MGNVLAGKVMTHKVDSYRIVVIGTGYVGLTAGACFSHLGHHVVCVDVDEAKLEKLRSCDIAIHEPQLANKVKAGLTDGSLSFVADGKDAKDAVEQADFVYLCLPTPSKSDGQADLSYVFNAALALKASLRSGTTVVIKSTVSPGTTLKLEEVIGLSDVGVVFNPEFLREGTAVADFLNPDRIVIGASDTAVADRVAALHQNIDAPILITDPTSAETGKYAANAFLATKLSFVNSIAAVCEHVNADIEDVMQSLGYDKRIGSGFLKPGPGWGGSCLPKDSKALLAVAEAAGYSFSLLRNVLAVNDEQFRRIVDKVAHRIPLQGACVALLGLAFKAGTNDLRSSPAIAVAKLLVSAGAHVQAWDPVVSADAVAAVVSDAESPLAVVATEAESPLMSSMASSMRVASDAYEACKNASALLIATEWEEFRSLDMERVADAMQDKHIIDARNLLDANDWKRYGFTYTCVGRPCVT